MKLNLYRLVWYKRKLKQKMKLYLHLHQNHQQSSEVNTMVRINNISLILLRRRFICSGIGLRDIRKAHSIKRIHTRHGNERTCTRWFQPKLKTSNETIRISWQRQRHATILQTTRWSSIRWVNQTTITAAFIVTNALTTTRTTD